MGSSEFNLEIVAVDARCAEAVELIRLLSAELAWLYDFVDDGSGFFKTEDVLVKGSVFLIGKLGGRAVACGAYRPMEDGAAEIKRMFVMADCRGRGFSKLILTELERRAAGDGYKAVRLETGNRQVGAIALYQKSGYGRIANYGPWENDERSLCFEKRLEG